MPTRFRQFLLLIVLATAPVEAADTVYLVRHAEKGTDGSSNPALTAVGEARALWLAGYFKDKGLTAIYSTDYVRTQATAAPTAKMAGLAVQSYDPRALPAFAATLEAMPGTVLVVGHSNTAPILAGLLAGQKLEELDERVYDHIYAVQDGTLRIDHSEPRTPLDPVAGLRDAMVARLALMADVAAYKWNRRLPVSDTAREAEVLDATVARARAEGLEGHYALNVVTAQMLAAKTVQNRLFAAWEKAGAGTIENVPDLQAELRPRITALTGDLLVELKRAPALMASCAAQQALKKLPETLTEDAMAWAVATDGVISGRPCT